MTAHILSSKRFFLCLPRRVTRFMWGFSAAECKHRALAQPDRSLKPDTYHLCIVFSPQRKKTLEQISVFWRRRRDSNSRAGHPAYSLSRGAPSPLGYFSMVNQLYEIRRKTGAEKRNGGESGIRTHGSFESLVFKTSSLNRSDISPCGLKPFRFGTEPVRK